MDTSFNRSAPSNELQAKAELRKVTLTFNVTVPSATDGTGRVVHIAGFLDRLDGGLPQWNPGGVANLPPELLVIHLGSWDFVEKDGTCGELANGQLTLSYGANGQQIGNDTVTNWRNVPPCGN